ncbi:MAG: IS4 family transposase, partial [Methylococcales bacterium]|nr:IS4 family transposase [Methylococcales bacterium]
SMPQIMRTPAELEGAYRFFNNPRIDGDSVLAPHISCSWERAKAASLSGQWVLAMQDTTEMRFGGTKHRNGLGSLMNNGMGFYAHVGLLVCLVDNTSIATAVPLGVGASEILVRALERPKRPDGLSPSQWIRKRTMADDNEFLRWGRVSKSLDDAAANHDITLIHVADREADEFDLLTSLKSRGARFVVRQTKNRRIKRDESQAHENDALLLNDLLAQSHPILARREVSFETAATSGGRRRRKQARKGRTTMLEIHAVSTCVKRPSFTRSKASELNVNVVIVREAEPPAGQQAIEWRLLTSEPIETASDVLRIVDAYRARWLIEEFFKALKTGCNYERLQLGSIHRLKIALSLCFGLAWHMLMLRTLARDALNIPANSVLTKAQLGLLFLAASSKGNPWGVTLPPSPTANDMMYAIARMGGHIRANGPPGWQTLGRGFQELNRLVNAQQWLARCDES